MVFELMCPLWLMIKNVVEGGEDLRDDESI